MKSFSTLFGKKDSFSPADVEGLTLWYYADNESRVAKDSSNKVSAWLDKIGTQDAEQGTETAQPTWTGDSINGKPAIVFGLGSGTRLSCSPVPWEPEFSMFAVVKATAIPSEGLAKRIVSSYAGAGSVLNGMIIMDVVTSAGDARFRLVTTAGGSTFFGSAISIGETYLVSCIANSSRLTDCRINGVSEEQITHNSTITNYPIAIGEDFAGALSESWKGPIGEVIYANSQVSNADRDAIEAYLMAKWGIS